MDTAYWQCDKEIKIDFEMLKKDLKSFDSNFNANKYIEETQHLFFLSPEKWIQDYQSTIDSFVSACVIKAHKILIDKKYLIFSLSNSNKFYKLYKTNYDEIFDLIDQYLHKEQVYINFFVARKIKESQTQEVH